MNARDIPRASFMLKLQQKHGESGTGVPSWESEETKKWFWESQGHEVIEPQWKGPRGDLTKLPSLAGIPSGHPHGPLEWELLGINLLAHWLSCVFRV